jgi:hypothetical protein
MPRTPESRDVTSIIYAIVESEAKASSDNNGWRDRFHGWLIAQVVVHLPSKHQALSPNPSTTTKIKEER